MQLGINKKERDMTTMDDKGL